uniref:(northern house mosquito) hypothetical protein n=1 Tax=Culex pipiens TaxID=7175 RepID=A0A8D8I5U4_CULPI
MESGQFDNGAVHACGNPYSAAAPNCWYCSCLSWLNPEILSSDPESIFPSFRPFRTNLVSSSWSIPETLRAVLPRTPKNRTVQSSNPAYTRSNPAQTRIAVSLGSSIVLPAVEAPPLPGPPKLVPPSSSRKSPYPRHYHPHPSFRSASSGGGHRLRQVLPQPTYARRHSCPKIRARRSSSRSAESASSS